MVERMVRFQFLGKKFCERNMSIYLEIDIYCLKYVYMYIGCWRKFYIDGSRFAR